MSLERPSGIRRRLAALLAAILAASVAGASAGDAPSADVVIRNGEVYDGLGGRPFHGDVAVAGQTITYVGPRYAGHGRREIDAHSLAVSPGFINMLSQSDESLLTDPAAESDLRQGVTLEVLSEGESAGPLSAEMQRRRAARAPHPNFAWRTLGEYMEGLERQGVAVNFATYVGAATVRADVLGLTDVTPSADQLVAMRRLVRQSMEDGAIGVSSALIYVPGVYAGRGELTALSEEAGRCGGIYASHIRSEGDHFLEALDELIEISRASAAPAEIFHLKVGGRSNWSKMAAGLQRIAAARARGLRISADLYPYDASSTGLDAAMPPWVQDGGIEAWIARLKDTVVRARVIAEMQAPKSDWENVLRSSGPAGALLTGFRNPALRHLAGKTLAQVAAERGVSPQEAAIELVVEDGSRVEVIYKTMTEENIRREIVLPYVSVGSDAPAQTNTPANLATSIHPRAYGAFARVFRVYVREDGLLSTAEAVRRMTSLAATKLNLTGRGVLRRGAYADVVVFDPAAIADRATYLQPHLYATGVDTVLVNGAVAMEHGAPTGARAGRFVRGRAWRGGPQGGCRKSAGSWPWPTRAFARRVESNVMAEGIPLRLGT